MGKTVQQATIAMHRIIVNPNEPPKALNRIFWTRVGSEIVIEAGHFDIVELRTAINAPRESNAEPVEVDFFVTDRYVVSPNAVQDIYIVLKELFDDLVENKLIIPSKIVLSNKKQETH